MANSHLTYETCCTTLQLESNNTVTGSIGP